MRLLEGTGNKIEFCDVKDLNNLQMKYMRDTRETSEGQLHDLIKEKAGLLIKVEQA